MARTAHTKVNHTKTKSRWGNKMRDNRRVATGSKTAIVKGSGHRGTKRGRRKR